MSKSAHPLLKKYFSAGCGSTPAQPRICLVRTNSIAEVLAGWPLITELKQIFPDCHITTIVNEKSEAEAIVMADARIDHVIKLQSTKFSSLKAQLNQYSFDFVIAVFVAETPKRQPQHLLTLLLISGRKWVCFNNQWHAFVSKAGLILLIKAIFFFLQKNIGKALRKLQKPQIKNGNLDISDKNIKKILWLRPDFLGDVVLCLPTLTALKQHYPEAEIDAVVQKSTADIISNTPELTKLWKIDFPEFSNTPTPRRELDQIVQQMQERQYDLAIDLLGNDSVRELAYRLKIPYRVGPSAYANEQISFDSSHLLTHAISPPHLNQHYSYSRLQILHTIGLPTKEIPPRLYANLTSKDKILKYVHGIGANKSFAVIHTRTNLAAKTWNDSHFATVADYLIERYDLEVLFTGSPADKQSIDDLLPLVHNLQRVHNTAGEFSLNDLIALLQQAKIMVTVDTGPMHIAAAVQTPIVALLLPYFKHCYPFGQMDSTLIPDESAILTCFNNEDFSGKLLECITPQQVFEAIDRKMARQ